MHKSHNVSVLLYHYLSPAQYHSIVLGYSVYLNWNEICIIFSFHYDISIIEEGIDKEHVHYLIENIPTFCKVKILQLVRSITAKEVFRLHSEVKKVFWSDFYETTVCRHGDVSTIQLYVQRQYGE
ncbi:MAG: transposase [Prevotellaceae bacterium]|nr:transposase [Prevotellaceae bacterium]